MAHDRERTCAAHTIDIVLLVPGLETAHLGGGGGGMGIATCRAIFCKTSIYWSLHPYTTMADIEIIFAPSL